MVRCKQRKAFTIVEMVIVIAVIAILAAAMIPAISGVIRMANVSADKQFAASLNIQLAMESVDREILNENDLKAVINKYYGEGYFEDQLSPKSANYGYYFWYDYTNKTVVVGTAEEIAQLAHETPSEPTMSAVPMVGGRKTFSPASLRSDLIEGYYLMGCEGGVLNIIKTMEGLDDEQAYQDTLNQLKATEETLEKTLYQKLTVTTLETDYGIFACEGAQEYWYRSVTTTDVAVKPVFMYDPNAPIRGEEGKIGAVEEVDRNSGEPPITVAPGGIEIEISSDTKVDDGAWAGLFDGRVEVHVAVTNKEELKDIFHLGAMDSNMIIVVPGGVLPNGNECYFDPDNAFEIVYDDESGNKNLLVEVESHIGIENLNVEIAYKNSGNPGSDGDYFHEGTLYLAWDFEKASLSLKDNLSTSVVDWTVSDGALIQVSPKGVITLKEGVTLDAQKSFATITATLKKDSTKTHSVNVQMVFPTSLTWKLDSTQYSAPVTNGAITLSYTEATEFALALDAVGDTQSGYVKLKNTEFAINFATSGTLFTIENNNTLKLDPAKIATNPTQTITVTYGNADHTYISQTYTVTVKDNSSVGLKKNQITGTVTMGDYLFRVGNGNSFTLGKLFSAVTEGKTVKVESVNIYDASKSTGTNGRVAIAPSGSGFTATYTANSNWSDGTIDFSGTGVAIIEVKTAKGDVELAVEVVDGKNVFAAGDFTGATNYVLMNNITWGTSYNVVITGTIYGNGFAINAPTFAQFGGPRDNTAMFKLSGGTIDNLVINGPVYPELLYQSEASDSKPYYVAGVYATGDAKITNSMISGFRSPITANGSSLYLENTTLIGGNYGNLWLQTGSLTLNNVTTVQKATAATVGSGNVLGVGIVADAGINASNVTIQGNLTQYNWASQADANNMDSDIKSLVSTIFNNSELTHTVNGTKYINSGILFQGQTGTVNNAAQTNKASYKTLAVTGKFMGVSVSANVYTHASTNGAITSVPTYGGYTPNAQSAIKPDFKHNVSLTNGAVNLKLASGSATLNLPDYTVSKYSGQNVAVNITCPGATVDGKKITFTNAGTYIVTYTVADNWFFNADGTKHEQSISDTYTVTVVVSQAEHKDAVIDVSGVDSTIYMVLSGKTSDTDYAAYFAVLKGLKITDYNADGTSSAVSISAGTMPSGLTVTANNSEFTATKTKNSVYYLGDSKANDNNDYSSITITYKYVGKNGKTVTATKTYTGFGTYTTLEDNRSSICVTPDTLVTLADGTQKEIQHVTYEDELMVWNFYTGKYDVVPASVLVNHGFADYQIIKLKFDDGTEIKLVGEHGVYDLTENRFVYINASNVNEYVGHEFVKEGNGTYSSVGLVDYETYIKYTESYSILTSVYANAFLEGLLTITPQVVNEYFFPVFEVAEGLVYDKNSMEADISQYGLYEYEDFAEYVTYDEFISYNLAATKVAVGKGMLTYDEILLTIDLIHLLAK